MTMVKVKKSFRYQGEELEPGSTVQLPESVAQDVIERGYGEKNAEQEKGGIPEFGEPETEEKEKVGPDRIRETEEGLDVSDYGKPSNWLTADDVEVGDELEIRGTGWKSDRFERTHLNIPVEHEGEKYSWRVNKRNARAIMEAYGTNTRYWVGKKIAVTEIVEYPGLNEKGIIVKPVEN